MISKERFIIEYLIQGDMIEAMDKAKDICIEQTVEFPEDLITNEMIREEVFGQIESFEPKGNAYLAKISYAIEITAYELTQLLNVIFGNISIKEGIRVEKINLPESLLKHFKGPKFGRDGLRKLLNIQKRPLLFSAIKPMGLSAKELGELSYQMALGGIDIIKDDHGLSNQVFAPYEERVKYCVEGVEKANAETGFNSIYVPNITAPFNEIERRAFFAKETGAGGVLISPALTGFDFMRYLAEHYSFNLPIFSHPAFQGSYVTCNQNGFSHFAIYGQISRLAGADAVVYPNFGGRFAFSKEECQSIVKGTEHEMGNLKSIFPCPGGGMSLDRIPELYEVYGNEVVFLMGGGLFKHSDDLVSNCRYFREIVENI